MRKTAMILSSLVVAACTSYDPVTPAPVVVAPAAPVVTAPVGAPAGTVAVAPTTGATVVLPSGVRSGNGRIESITKVASAAAGTTGAASNTIQRIAVRMDDGTVQVLDTPASGLAIGERIELTKDGMLRH